MTILVLLAGVTLNVSELVNPVRMACEASRSAATLNVLPAGPGEAFVLVKLIVLAAFTKLPVGKLKLSPAWSRTLLAVDWMVTPLLRFRLSVVAGVSPADSVIAPLEVTLAATVSGLALVTEI